MQTIWNFRNKIAACVKLQNVVLTFKLKMIESRTKCKKNQPNWI